MAIKNRYHSSFAAILLVGVLDFGISSLSAQTRPNVVIFEPDDLDPVTFQTALRLGILPNIQKYLVSQGTSFENYYVSDARGCPTREGYLNGKNFHNIVPASSNHQCGVFQFDDKETLAVWLHNAGYSTSLIGKYLDGYGYEDLNGDGKVNQADATYIPPGWDNWQTLPYYEPVVHGRVPPHGVILPEDNPNEYDYYLTSNGSLTHHGTSPADYQADVLNSLAVTYARAQSAAKPFFMMVATGAPHIETNYTQIPVLSGYEQEWSWDVRPAPRYAGTVNAPLPNPPNFNDPNETGKPQWVTSKPLMNSTDINDDTKQWNDRLASLRAVDDLVGNVVTTLHARGLVANTVFMLLSDNGWMYGNWRLGGKLAPYDPSISSPLVVSVGGGVTSSAMVIGTDIAATVLDYAQVKPPYELDGTSFRPLLSAPATKWRNRYLVEHWQALKGGVSLLDCPDYRAVRTSVSNGTQPNLLYAEYNTKELELYHYNSDPWALTNLSSNPAYQQEIQQEHQEILQLAVCAGSNCHTAEFQ